MVSYIPLRIIFSFSTSQYLIAIELYIKKIDKIESRFTSSKFYQDSWKNLFIHHKNYINFPTFPSCQGFSWPSQRIVEQHVRFKGSPHVFPDHVEIDRHMAVLRKKEKASFACTRRYGKNGRRVHSARERALTQRVEWSKRKPLTTPGRWKKNREQGSKGIRKRKKQRLRSAFSQFPWRRFHRKMNRARNRLLHWRLVINPLYQRSMPHFYFTRLVISEWE